MKRRKFFLTLTGLSLFFCLCLISSNSFAATIYVDDSNTTGTENGTAAHPYNTVTEGINASAAGDTISVAAGTYSSETYVWNLNKANLTLQGAGALGSSVTTIVGDNSTDNPIRITANNVKLKNFAFRNSLALPSVGYIGTTQTPVVTGVEFHNLYIYDSATAGSVGSIGIDVYNSTATAYNVICNNLDVGFLSLAIEATSTFNCYNCVAYDCSISGGAANQGFSSLSFGNNPTLNVYNSIALKCGTAIGQYPGYEGGSITSNYNLFPNSTVTNGNTTTYGTGASAGAHDLAQTLNPFFVDPANTDFRLQSKNRGYTYDSPCIDAGTSTGALTTDMEGTTRPQGSAFDIGAYESPAKTGYLTSFTKQANKKKASVGQVISYTLTIKNNTFKDIINATVSDTLPQGFKYLTGSAKLNNSAISNPTGARTRTFTLGTLSAGTTYTLKYKTVIGSGVGYGKSTNTAYLLSTSGNGLSSTAEETVLIVPNPIFNAATIIGKVYQDLNKNGYPDENEPGLEDIALLTEDGFMVITDEYGRYHLDGLKPQTKVIALDTKTLPKGAKLTTENPVLLRLTPALTMKANFGVYIPEGETKK